MEPKVTTQPQLNYTDWCVTETRFEPSLLQARETVFTLGNGYLGTRGTFEEGYPGSLTTTIIHGVYDDVPVVYTELVNCPDWLPLLITIKGERFRLDQGDIINYQRKLDIYKGILTRQIRWRSPNGNTIDLSFERFASIADEHVLAVRCKLKPVNFEGKIEVQAGISGYPENQGVLHWEFIQQGELVNEESGVTDSLPEAGVWLEVKTRNTGIELGMATRLQVTDAEDAQVRATGCEGHPNISATFYGKTGQTVTLEKTIAVFTSRDTEAPAQITQKHLLKQPNYDQLSQEHQAAWAKIWEDSDVVIEGDPRAQIAIRYNLFQIIICAPRNDDRVSTPAKTLSGFGYRGHVFWDTEIFITPVFTLIQPKVARNLLHYRYHTLPGARRKARKDGYQGAVYAWESADTGDEVTPRWILPGDQYGEPIRIWCGDRELHITCDVAYAIWQYWRVTGDDEWVINYGAEIVFDTAVFWGTRAEWNGKHERYELRNVIGPDEYHEHIHNNTFTNRMVQWHLEIALYLLDWMRENAPEKAKALKEQLDLNPDRLKIWSEIIKRMWIPYDHDRDLVEQCEGFFDIEDINLEDYEPRTKSMQALLGIEGASKKQVLKQPDVLMMMFLLRGLQGQETSGLTYDLEALQRNWDYYVPRTDHTYGSSLGPAIHALLACDLNKTEEAYEHYMRAAMVDLENVRGNAGEGIHAASTGGLWQATVFGCGGITLTDQGPVANPHLMPGWTRLKFKLQWRGEWFEFDLSADGKNGEGATKVSTISSPIKGVIFDLDGVITDTAEYHYRAWQQLADEEGIPFNREMNEGLRGVSRRDSLLKLLDGRSVSDEKFEAMMERKNSNYVESIKQITPGDLLPGALELLNELQAAGIKIALGSASKNAKPVVKSLGIEEKLDVIGDGYSVTKSKPAPDLFLYAAEQMGLKPEECIVVEDAGSGVEAALAAGMGAVGLGPVERVGAAHVVLPNLAGVRLRDLLDKFASRDQEASLRAAMTV